MIADSHSHAVSADVARYPRRRAPFPAEWLTARPHDADQLVAVQRAAGVDHGLLVQPQAAYGHDNRYVLEAGRALRDRLSVVVSIDPADRRAPELVTEAAASEARGVRLFSIPTPEIRVLAEPVTDALWAATVEAGLVVSVCVLAPELGDVARAATRHPDATILVDHCGFVALPDDADLLDALAACPNVVGKITGHLLHEAEGRGVDARAVVGALVDRFGADRLVWGSDFPQTPLSYSDNLELAQHAFSALAADERDAVMGSTTARLYGLA